MNLDWFDISYLQQGTQRQQTAYGALESLGIFGALAEFTPLLVGSIPLGIDTPDSDLDIICELEDIGSFIHRVTSLYWRFDNFTLRRGTADDLPLVVASFAHEGFPIEIFAQSRPVLKQTAHIHMMVEHRLLQIGGEAARDAIRALKQDGLRTESAFARAFGLDGDPSTRLLELAGLDDEALRAAIGR